MACPAPSRSPLSIRVDVPRALAPLLRPARYKAAYGGRGGAKSHFFAEQLVLRCYAGKTRAVCIREVQNSIADSVKRTGAVLPEAEDANNHLIDALRYAVEGLHRKGRLVPEDARADDNRMRPPR